MEHPIHDSGGQHDAFLIAEGWSRHSALGNICRHRSSQSTTDFDPRLGLIYRGDQVPPLVVLALNLTKQSDDNVLF
jgi:hypothetical protein